MKHHQLDPSEIEKLLADMDSGNTLDSHQKAYVDIFRMLKKHGGQKITVDTAAKQRLRQELLQSYDAPLKKSNFLGIFRWITSPLVGSVLAFSFIGIITISFYSQLFFESKSVGDMPQIQSTESMKGNLPTYMKQEEYQETSNTSSPVMSPSESMNNGFGVKKYDKNGSSLDMISGKTNDVSSTLKGSTGGENSFELYQVYLLISVIIGVGLYFFILRWRKNKDI